MNNVPVHTKISYLQIADWLTLVPCIHSRQHLQQEKDSRRFSFDIPRNFKWRMEQQCPQFPEKSTHARFPKVYFRKRPFLVIFISDFPAGNFLLNGSHFIHSFQNFGFSKNFPQKVQRFRKFLKLNAPSMTMCAFAIYHCMVKRNLIAFL